MAWELLPVDYTDAVWSGLKRYNLINNEDDTVSLQDVTVYSNKEKSFFGAHDANRMNEALNTIMSMIENGTDLYEAFQIYFNQQKTAFETKANTEQAAFKNYIANLEAEGDGIVQTLKTDYREEITQFESTQEQVFQTWFDFIKGQLSEDAAGNLQNQINENTTKITENTTQINLNKTEIATLKTTTAPKNHASSATTYGVASTTNYGHVKYGKDSLTACRGDDERLVPVATVLAYTSNRTAYPTGYLLCRGQAVSRTTYSKLFENLGTRYGSGDGSTTFNLPDLQTRVPVGFKSGDSDFGTLGKSGGSKTRNLYALIGNPNGQINQLAFTENLGTDDIKTKNAFTRRFENLTVNNDGAAISNVTPVVGWEGTTPSVIQPYVTMDYIIKY